MLKIPYVCNPQDDELLYSWLLRLSRINGFKNVIEFANCYIYPNHDIHGNKVKYLSYDCNEYFEAFYNALPDNFGISLIDLYLKTSIFSGIMPFSSRTAQVRYINKVFYRDRRFEELYGKIMSYIPYLKVCPQCMQADKEKLGYFYVHRAHQMPGVTMCYKHGCALSEIRYRSRYITYSSMSDEPELHEMKTTLLGQKYARFCKDFLDLNTDMSLVNITILINKKIGIHKKKGGDYSHIFKQMEAEGYYELTNGSIPELFKRTLYKNITVDANTVLVLLFYLFQDVKEIQEMHLEESIRKGDAVDNHYLRNRGYSTDIEKYRNDICRIRHDACGTELYTSMTAFRMGWQCYNCDKAKTTDDKIRDIVAHVGEGEYEVLTPFETMNKKVKLRHKKCGSTFDIAPANFIYYGVRCECERLLTYPQIKEVVEENEGFHLLDYDSKQKRLHIHHDKCGKNFYISYVLFADDPVCRICGNEGHVSVRTEEIFKHEIMNLTGEEYTLVGPYVDEKTKVLIKHNTCGTVFSVQANHFLAGVRCPQCTYPVSRKQFSAYVSGISRGRYTVTGFPGCGQCTIRDNTNNSETKITRRKAMQEFKRLTPSPIFPIENKDSSVTITRQENKVCSFKTYIETHFKEDDLFTQESIADLRKITVETAGNYLAQGTKQGWLIRVAFKIYARSGEQWPIEKIIEKKYLVSNGHRIGYIRGIAFAYLLGLIKKVPFQWNLMINGTEGCGELKGCRILIKTAQMEVTDDNWLIQESLDFVMNYKRYITGNDADVMRVLREYICKNHNGKMFSREDYDPYLSPYYGRKSKKALKERMPLLLGEKA